MEDKAKRAATESRKSNPHLLRRGLLFTIGFSVLVWVAVFALLLVWLEQFDVRPDFGSNGLLWITTTILTIDLFFLPVFFGLWMMLIIPKFVQLRSQKGKIRRDKLILHVTATAVLVVLRTLMYGTSPFDLWLVFSLPVVVVAVAGGEVLLRRNIKALQKSIG